jgi:glycosyltransferase involved in cell wall biosynthesis
LRTYHILKGAAKNHNLSLLSLIQLKEETIRENVDHLRRFCRSVELFRLPVDISRSKLYSTLFFNLFSPLPFVAQKYDIPAMRTKIEEQLDNFDIELVHVDMLPLTVYINQFPTIPKILVNHNVESLRLYRWYQAERNVFKKIYLALQYHKLRSFERSAMNKFNCCTAVSETDKELLMKMGVKSKIFVVPNGTDTDFFRPGIDKPIRNLVLWVGHMDVHTNKDAVLYFWREIYPLLRRRHSQIHMTFVGTAPPKEIAEAAEKTPQVKVTGFVHDIRPYVQKAAVVVVPIRIGSGTRIKILDTMAMGKAIVSTSIGCEGLNVTDRENILIADDPKDFASNIIKLMQNDHLRKTLEKNAVNLAKNYSWQLINKEQEQVYQYAIKGRRRCKKIS